MMFNTCCVCQPPKSNFSAIDGLNEIQVDGRSSARCSSCEQIGPQGACSLGGPAGCSACGGPVSINSKMAGEIPWLKPMPIACADSEEHDLVWSFPLKSRELDDGELPGRPSFRVQCIKVCGDTRLALRDCGELGDPYQLCVCARIPVEIVIADACNCTYCLHSYYTQFITIPTCRKAELLGHDLSAYVKVCVSLAYTDSIEAGSLSMDGDDNNDCSYDAQDTEYWLPPVTLASTVSVCLTKMVPYGVVCS